MVSTNKGPTESGQISDRDESDPMNLWPEPQVQQSSLEGVGRSEIGPRDLFLLFLREKLLILCITTAVTLVALIASLVLPKTYKATVLVAPISNPQNSGPMSGVSSMLSGLGGLASLVGASPLGSAKAQDIATLKSEALTQSYIQQNGLMPILFASKWNSRLGRWRTEDPRKIPTLWDANRYFAKHVRSVTEDGTTGLYRVTISWNDPRLAAKWANGLVAMTNKYLRDKAISEINLNISYLKNQATKTSMVAIRSAIFDLMQGEIRNAMIAQGQPDYALKVIDPAFVPEKPSSPLPLLWTAIGLFVGLFCSFGIVLFKARRVMRS